MTCVVCTLEIDDGDILLDLECGHSIGLWPQVGQAITPDPFRGGVNVSFAGVLLSQTERIMPEDWRGCERIVWFFLDLVWLLFACLPVACAIAKISFSDSFRYHASSTLYQKYSRLKLNRLVFLGLSSSPSMFIPSTRILRVEATR